MVSSLRHLNGTAADNVLSRDIRDRPLTAGPRSCDEQWIDRNRHRTRIRMSAIGTPGSFMPAERVTASHRGRVKRRSPTIIEKFTVAERATAWRIFRILYSKSNRIACFRKDGDFSHGLHPTEPLPP